MADAQQRRELADKLEKGNGFREIQQAATLLRSDATALEAVGVEPMATCRRSHQGPYTIRTHLEWHNEPTEDGEHKLYPASVALRLSEALEEVERLKRQRDALAKALQLIVQWDDEGLALCEHHIAGAKTALKEIGNE